MKIKTVDEIAKKTAAEPLTVNIKDPEFNDLKNNVFNEEPADRRSMNIQFPDYDDTDLELQRTHLNNVIAEEARVYDIEASKYNKKVKAFADIINELNAMRYKMILKQEYLENLLDEATRLAERSYQNLSSDDILKIYSDHIDLGFDSTNVAADELPYYTNPENEPELIYSGVMNVGKNGLKFIEDQLKMNSHMSAEKDVTVPTIMSIKDDDAIPF
jgi:hypothetical protein